MEELKTLKIIDGHILLGKRRQNTGFVYSVTKNGRLRFSNIESSKTESLLTYIDSALPQIISKLLPWIYKRGGATFSDVCKTLVKDNPLELEEKFSLVFYKNLLAKFASGLVSYMVDDNGTIINACDFIYVQHGKYFQKVWPIQTQLPSVLMPYLSFDVVRKKCDYSENGINYRVLKLIVKYVDKTAPTQLGNDLSKSLCEVDLQNNALFDTITAMSCRVHDKYIEQVSFFGKDTIDMVNKQVY